MATFLSNPHGLKKRRGKRTWQNVSWLLPNLKYLKHHTRQISNPNTCLDSPTSNGSCSCFIKWIVFERKGSDGRASLKRMADAGVVGQLALENVHISCPCEERGASVVSPTKLLIWLPCRMTKTYIIWLYCVACRKNSAPLVSLPLCPSFIFQRVKMKRNMFCISLCSHEWRPNEEWWKQRNEITKHTVYYDFKFLAWGSRTFAKWKESGRGVNWLVHCPQLVSCKVQTPAWASDSWSFIANTFLPGSELRIKVNSLYILSFLIPLFPCFLSFFPSSFSPPSILVFFPFLLSSKETFKKKLFY